MTWTQTQQMMNNELVRLKTKMNITRNDLNKMEQLTFTYLSSRNTMTGVYKGLVDDNLKTFSSGKMDKMFNEIDIDNLEKISKKYNSTWLKTEGQTVEEVIESTKEMETVIGKETEEYDIEWVTADDEKVRHDHARMHGMILDSKDPFCQQYGLPPQEYNCRCTYIKVPKKRGKKGDIALTESLKKEKEKLGIGNPYEGEIFNRNHNYLK